LASLPQPGAKRRKCVQIVLCLNKNNEIFASRVGPPHPLGVVQPVQFFQPAAFVAAGVKKNSFILGTQWHPPQVPPKQLRAPASHHCVPADPFRCVFTKDESTVPEFRGFGVSPKPRVTTNVPGLRTPASHPLGRSHHPSPSGRIRSMADFPAPTHL